MRQVECSGSISSLVSVAFAYRAYSLDQVRAWYERKGKYGLVISYFIPGIRHLAAYVAGSSWLPLPVFATMPTSGTALVRQLHQHR
jgi:membrane protein DedA with SNARE-associated domain